jgi:hypothetical protein
VTSASISRECLSFLGAVLARVDRGVEGGDSLGVRPTEVVTLPVRPGAADEDLSMKILTYPKNVT